jgi:hypothetical protein
MAGNVQHAHSGRVSGISRRISINGGRNRLAGGGGGEKECKGENGMTQEIDSNW